MCHIMTNHGEVGSSQLDFQSSDHLSGCTGVTTNGQAFLKISLQFSDPNLDRTLQLKTVIVTFTSICQRMKKIHSIKIIAITVTIFLAACTPRAGHENIDTDSLVIAKGETLFKQNCSACHNFRQDAIGPQLAGVTEL